MMPGHSAFMQPSAADTAERTSVWPLRMPDIGALNILIHARIRDFYESMRASLEQRRHRVEGAFSVEEGALKMRQGRYDRIFIDIGVPNVDRLSLMTLAGELRASTVEIIDRDTVEREIMRGRLTNLR